MSRGTTVLAISLFYRAGLCPRNPLATANILLGPSLGTIRDTYIRLDSDGILGLASTDTSNRIAAAMAGKKVKAYEKVSTKAQIGTA